MKKHGMGLWAFLLVILSFGMIMILGQLLPRNPGNLGEETVITNGEGRVEEGPHYLVSLEPLNYYTIQIQWPQGLTLSEDQSPGQFLAEAGFPVVVWYPLDKKETVDIKIELGFTGDKATLEPWLKLLKDKDMVGVLWERTFPEQTLKYKGELRPELPELMALLNEQLRHLSRAADFFSHPWHRLQSQEITEQRLKLLQQEANQCKEKMKKLLDSNQYAEKEVYASLYQRLSDWHQKLVQLEENKEEIQIWIAQQKAQALICQWQQLLWEIGFL